MKQLGKENDFVYPFGNPHSEQEEDAESYHSVTNDDRKFRYFDDDQQLAFSKKVSESMIKKKNQLPPVYPYEEMKKLKESMKLREQKFIDQTESNGQFDTQSIRSVDSFHTANEFQSIYYEEGDYEKIAGEMGEEETKSKDFKESDKSEKSIDVRGQIKQSDALDEAQLEELENSRSEINESSLSKYEKSDQKDINKEKSSKIQKEHSQIYHDQEQERHQEETEQGQEIDTEKSVEISRIDQVLNESIQVDNEILELTKELGKAQSSQEELMTENSKNNHEEWNRKKEELIKKYDLIEKRISELQKVQRYFTTEISGMAQLMKKTQENNLYLKKEVEFFKYKFKEYQEEKQRHEELYMKEKEERLREKNDLNMSNVSRESDRQGMLGGSNRKSKTYNIRPKAPNNQSYQSRKYKELTFEYCLGMQQIKNSDERWMELEVDRENTPAEYKLIYSFQQQHTLLVIRLVDVAGQQEVTSTESCTKPTQIQTIKKNYHYMMDFANNKYPTREQKIQSLTKELIVHLDESAYCWKEFTKKIEVFLIITEDEMTVDLVRVLPLPNPIIFYAEERFVGLEKDNNECKTKIEAIEKSSEPKQEQNVSQTINKYLSNIHKLMKVYIIKIEHMADIHSIQKLFSIPWINTTSDPEPKYFSIRHKPQLSEVEVRNQLFYVKIENCVLENKEEEGKEQLGNEHKYSLTFRVASNTDNALLIDMIEFLTFLTVL